MSKLSNRTKHNALLGVTLPPAGGMRQQGKGKGNVSSVEDKGVSGSARLPCLRNQGRIWMRHLIPTRGPTVCNDLSPDEGGSQVCCYTFLLHGYTAPLCKAGRRASLRMVGDRLRCCGGQAGLLL